MLRRIDPWQLREVAVPAGTVGGADEAEPVDDGAVRTGRGKAIGVAHDPRRQHAAARAAEHVQALRIHIAAVDDRVHRCHQVVEVLAGIGILDRVAEGAAVARGAARVGVEQHVTVRDMILTREVEPAVVHRVRTAVNLQHQRVLLRGIEVGRLHDPALDAESVHAGEPHFLGATQLLAGQHIVIDVREARDGRRRAHVEAHDVVGLQLGGLDADHVAHAIHVGHAEHLLAGGHLSRLACERGEIQVAIAFVLDVVIHAAAVQRPHHALRCTIQRGIERAGIRAVGIHQVDVCILPRRVGRIVAGVRDQPAVWRCDRVAVRTLAAREPNDGARADICAIDLGLAPCPFGIGGPQAAEQQCLAVRCPARGAVIPVAIGDGTCLAAFGRHHEQVLVAIIREADAIGAIVQALHDARRFRPFCALGLRRQRDVPGLACRDVHAERDL